MGPKKPLHSLKLHKMYINIAHSILEIIEIKKRTVTRTVHTTKPMCPSPCVLPKCDDVTADFKSCLSALRAGLHEACREARQVNN